LEHDIELWIERDMVMISWNDETIQDIAEEMGQPEFSEPRPCG